MIDRIDDQKFIANLKSKTSGHRNYRACYSSFLGGITTQVHHMVIPLDEHMVHRGDAVFEAAKFVNRKVYLVDEHLERLAVSANSVQIESPLKKQDMKNIFAEVIKASALTDGVLRIYLSRGPGGFSPNPYETIGAQFYVVVTDLVQPVREKYENGVRVDVSALKTKEGFFAQTKTCNYLPNVLMKKEAVDRGLDFVINTDEEGCLAEGATENFALIMPNGDLLFPSFARMLKGCTLIRAAAMYQGSGRRVEQKSIRLEDIKHAKAGFMAGTTIDILPIAEFAGHKLDPKDADLQFIKDLQNRDWQALAENS